MVDDEVNVRRDEPGVVFRVAHTVDDDTSEGVRPGGVVSLRVDQQRRRQLSAAHTACHLLAYALNAATHHLWRKTRSHGHWAGDLPLAR